MGLNPGARRGYLGPLSRLRTWCAEIGSAVETLLNHKDLTLQDSDAAAAALKRFRERATVGFSDCLLLELARKAGARSTEI